jgi:sugar phosphate isomerase/epimerase
MHNFGFKIIDRAPSQLGLILDYAIEQKRPVEVGLYQGDPAALDLLERRLAPGHVAVNAHTNHERCHALNLHLALDQLDAHIRQARSLGSGYSVLHAANMPLTQRAEKRSALMALLLDNLERAEALCAKHDYRLNLENVYHPLAFYRELFDGILSRGLARIHFCFDIGHAKVWSAETLDDWLAFMDELTSRGVRLHMHLHANQGITDEHLSLAEAQALGICGADGYFNAYGYPGAYWRIERRFPEAVKVFEVKAERAIENMEALTASAIPSDS